MTKIESGYGIIDSIQGASVDLAENISYTVSYVLPSESKSGILHQIPMQSRYPAPLLVRALPVNMAFPVYKVNGVLQTFMPRELPDFRDCQVSPEDSSFGIFAAILAMSDDQKRAIAAALKEFM